MQTRALHFPTLIGMVAALTLFVLFRLQLLNEWSANTDHPAMGYDYFGWPRAALAIRNGTDPFAAHDDYPLYGPYATRFVTFPALAVAGVPLTYLSPWAGFWIVSVLALLLHLAIIYVFGERACTDADEYSTLDIVFMLSMGLFMPWYVMYYMGQYHSIAVLAVFLVLAWRRFGAQAAGFTISALAKPVLGPAALVLLVRTEWKLIWTIVALLAITMGPWIAVRHDSNGLHIGQNPTIVRYTQEAALIAKYTEFRWNQQISLAAALDEFLSPKRNLQARFVITLIVLAASIAIAIRGDRQAALCMALMWFFVFYARGHEYHYTLLVPVMLCLWSLPGERYQTWWVAALAIAAAAPTTWVFFKYAYHFPDPETGSCNMMAVVNPLLYYVFLWHKPAVALLLSATIARVEWGQNRARARAHARNRNHDRSAVPVLVDDQ